MRAILMFHNYDGQSHNTVPTDHNFWREMRAENQGPFAYQPNALLLGHTSSPEISVTDTVEETDLYLLFQ